MLRALLDCNAVDPIADQPGALDAVEAAIARGDLQLLITAAAFQEIAEARDVDRRVRLLLAVHKADIVPDGAIVLDRTRIGLMRFGDESDYQHIRAGNDSHIEDALIAMGAKAEGAVLVTNEKRLPKKAHGIDVETMTTAELLGQIGYKPPSGP